MEPGSLVYTQWLNERGGIEADVTVSRTDPERFMITTAIGSYNKDWWHLKKHLQGEAQLRDISADYACLARDAGARLIGGCCGSMPEHIRAMRTALEAHVSGPPPSLDQLRARIGEFSSASDGTGAAAEAAADGRRSRRARRRASCTCPAPAL